MRKAKQSTSKKPEPQSKLCVVLDKAREKAWRAALERSAGNITSASLEFGFSKQRGSVLTRRFGLAPLARKLRLAAGKKKAGRPKKGKGKAKRPGKAA